MEGTSLVRTYQRGRDCTTSGYRMLGERRGLTTGRTRDRRRPNAVRAKAAFPDARVLLGVTARKLNQEYLALVALSPAPPSETSASAIFVPSSLWT